MEIPEGEGAIVLVVDDDVPLLGLARMLLSGQGYRVVAMEDPIEALEFYRQKFAEIDIVLLDFAMPGMDGAELFEQMLDVSPKVKALLISGYAKHDSIRTMLDSGLKGYLPKPYTSEDLIEAVEGILKPEN